MINELQACGLSERESRVYVASLTLGKATVEQLSKQASIIRTTTYTQVESLLEKGLLSTVTEGKKTFYMPESPEHLEALVSHQVSAALSAKTELANSLPALLQLFGSSSDRPVVRYFEGKAGLETMRGEVLKMKGKELRIITSYDDFVKVFSSEKERDEFTRKRKRKKIKTKAIYTSSNPPDPKAKNVEDELKIDETVFPIEFDVYLFDNTVAISSLKDSVWGVMIEGNAVSKSMHVLFELVWSLAKR